MAMTPQRQAALDQMAAYGRALIAEKRRRPNDDMLSAVVHAELPDADPPRLTEDELSGFFSLLFSAGAETTRNAVAGALVAFLEWPRQLERLRAGEVGWDTTVEEILRWTTPSPSKRRTATRDCTLGGRSVTAGDKVVVWEASANRDPRRFGEPDAFDAGRDPNPHLAFGHGVHFCLGAHLARLEIRVALDEVVRAVSSYELTAPVEWTRSNRHTGIRHLPLRLVRARRLGQEATGEASGR
jgi:cytochrome P450